jgi:hypothetical protein
MGKRELLLIVAFAVMGALVYQLSAPASPTASRVSASGVIDHLRRAVRGNRSSAELTTSQALAVDAAVTDLRLRLRSATVVIEGEARADIAVELLAWSNGYDDAEAQSLAKQVRVKLDPAGNTVIANIDFPEPGTQRATVKLKVPDRLRVRVDNSGPVTIANVASVELNAARGTAAVSRVAGTVTGSHRGGTLNLTDVGSVKLSTQAVDLRVVGTKDLALTIRSGEAHVEGVAGTMEIESNQADVTLQKLERVAPPLRINANGGTVTVAGLQTEARIDGRNTALTIAMDRAAPVAIYNEGDEDIAFTPPPGGFKLDVLVREGELTPPYEVKQLGLTPTTSEEQKEVRAAAAVGGGGPTITLRAVRGDVVLKPRAAAPAAPTAGK